MKTKNGFSLVEVIIMIGILAVIGVITSTILTRTYRAGSQSETISKLKQNGDLAIKMMDETIRKAETVVCYDPTAPVQSLVVRTQSGTYTKFRFVDPVPPSGTPTQNGFIVKQENLSSADLASFCTTTLASPPEIPITNNNSASGVSVTGGQFLKIAGTQGKDTITISFNVNPSLKSGGTLQSETAFIQTTVQIR